MTPLMQTIFDELRSCYLDRYIDGFQRDVCAAELQRLHSALAAAMPEGCLPLLQQYLLTLRARSLMELEAMFQAAFAAGKELA